MPTAKDYLAQPPLFLILALGPPNSGKSDLAMTFPKCYVASFDPEGFAILKGNTERAKLLSQNLVYIETFNPHGEVETKRLYARTKQLTEAKPGHPATYGPVNAADRSTHLMGWLKHVEEVGRAGEIQTVVLDGLNYLVSQKFNLCCLDSKNFTKNRDGDEVLDRFAVYRDLKNYLTQFMWAELLPLCTAHRLNLIVTCHVKRLSEEQIEGKKQGEKQVSVGKVVQDSDIAPIIDGGFRDEIDGKFGAVIYTMHELKTNVQAQKREHVFTAVCNKSPGLETLLNAKNKYSLPDRLIITNKSFYEELLARNAGLPIASAPVAAGAGEVKAK
jgi:hypothetical protein